jgi:hypothetical protein
MNGSFRMSLTIRQRVEATQIASDGQIPTAVVQIDGAKCAIALQREQVAWSFHERPPARELGEPNGGGISEKD